MGDVVPFLRRQTAGLLPKAVAVLRPGPDGWPDGLPVVDKLTGRTGTVVGRGWSLNFLGVRTCSVRWDDRPHLPADIVFVSRLMPLRPTPRNAVVTLPGGRILRRLPPGVVGRRAEVTWGDEPDFDEPPPDAA